jgi:hypothetical protein
MGGTVVEFVVFTGVSGTEDNSCWNLLDNV